MTPIHNQAPIERFANHFAAEWAYAQVVKAGQFIFVSGTVAMDPDGSIKGQGDMVIQIRTVYQALTMYLQQAGASMDDVVKETIHTTDLAAFIANKSVRAEYFKPERLPASGAWHQVSQLAHPDFLVEVDVIAYIQDSN